MPAPAIAPRSAPPPYAATGRRLGRATLGLAFGVVAVITLVPFSFAVPAVVRLTLWDNAFEAVANVALFVPLGFLHALMQLAGAPRADGARGRAGRAFLLGALVSAVIECVQLFEPERYPSPVDVATNALGAYLGAWAHGAVASRLTARSGVVGRLALELPLMGLVYLTLPLCTLASLTLAGSPTLDGWGGTTPALGRAAGLLALAGFGGTLLGQVQQRHLGPAGALSAPVMTAAAAAWFAVGALPAFAVGPRAFVAGIVVAGGTAWAHGRPRPHTPINRRFEIDALTRAGPFLVAYVALLAIGDPPALPTAGLTRVDILRRLEGLVAFAVVGYVLAEAWGRQHLRYRFTAARVALVASAAGPLVEALRLADMPSLDAAPTILVRALAAAYGGWMYHLQRAHVRALVAARDGEPRASVELAAHAPPARPARVA